MIIASHEVYQDGLPAPLARVAADVNYPFPGIMHVVAKEDLELTAAENGFALSAAEDLDSDGWDEISEEAWERGARVFSVVPTKSGLESVGGQVTAGHFGAPNHLDCITSSDGLLPGELKLYYVPSQTKIATGSGAGAGQMVGEWLGGEDFPYADKIGSVKFREAFPELSDYVESSSSTPLPQLASVLSTASNSVVSQENVSLLGVPVPLVVAWRGGSALLLLLQLAFLLTFLQLGGASMAGGYFTGPTALSRGLHVLLACVVPTGAHVMLAVQNPETDTVWGIVALVISVVGAAVGLFIGKLFWGRGSLPAVLVTSR